SSRVSDSASQQLSCSSPSSWPPASPGFPAAAAPSQTPSARREPSRRRRPHAKATPNDSESFSPCASLSVSTLRGGCERPAISTSWYTSPGFIVGIPAVFHSSILGAVFPARSEEHTSEL